MCNDRTDGSHKLPAKGAGFLMHNYTYIKLKRPKVIYAIKYQNGTRGDPDSDLKQH